MEVRQEDLELIRGYGVVPHKRGKEKSLTTRCEGCMSYAVTICGFSIASMRVIFSAMAIQFASSIQRAPQPRRKWVLWNSLNRFGGTAPQPSDYDSTKRE
jgi:hypothetical protein